MQSFAHGIARPAQEGGRLPLTEVEGLDRLCHEVSASGTVEGIRGLHQPGTHRRIRFHGATSCFGEVGIVQNSSGRIIFLNPPERSSSNRSRTTAREMTSPAAPAKPMRKRAAISQPTEGASGQRAEAAAKAAQPARSGG